MMQLQLRLQRECQHSGLGLRKVKLRSVEKSREQAAVNGAGPSS